MRLILVLASLVLAAAAADTKHEMVAMRDGIRLSTSVTLPAGPGPFPAILIRTPYAISGRTNPYVAAGYAVVEQNLRGLFRSEGKWPAFASEIRDGYDTVEWIASNSWSDGRVGVTGGSGPGIAGYMALMSGAPHLSAGVIEYAHASMYSTVSYPGGVYQASLLDSWMSARGVDVPPPFPRPLFRRFDAYYLDQDIARHAHTVTAPILHVTGWFDIFTQGTIDYFNAAQKSGTGKARGNQKLIILPGGHGGRMAGELRWPVTLPGSGDIARQWFDYWLRGTENGARKVPAAQYYVMGNGRGTEGPGNQWKSSTAWPPVSEPMPFYLQPEGGLGRSAPKTPGGGSSFEYDPRNPVPSVQSRPDDWLNRLPLDQRVLSKRADILRFMSLPLTEPLEICGEVRAELWVSTTAKDTDFFARLIDIYPDGYEALMASQPLRLRFRAGFDRMLPARPNRVYPIDIRLWSTAMVFEKGHRIGVQVTSSDVPRFDRHTNTWEPVKRYEESEKATNTVHHSARYPSRIVLPAAVRKR